LCGGANLVLASALLCAFSAQAQHYPASLDAPTKRDLDNIDQLLAIAQANGNVRVDIKFKLPTTVNSINTPAELNARRQAILAYIDAVGTGFRARYGNNVIETPGNPLVHAEVSPMLQVTLTSTGATQLMSDTSVSWVSNQANVTAFLKEINSSLAVSNSGTHTFRVRACQGVLCSKWSSSVLGHTLDRCVP
jgi:hypothetical protein